MFDAHNHNHTGRVGLWKIDVTPLVYLQLLDKLHSGRKVTYNETELQFAFKSYLEKTKGPWKKDDLKDLTGLTKVADDYVGKQKEKFEAEQKKMPPANRKTVSNVPFQKSVKKKHSCCKN